MPIVATVAALGSFFLVPGASGPTATTMASAAPIMLPERLPGFDANFSRLIRHVAEAEKEDARTNNIIHVARLAGGYATRQLQDHTTDLGLGGLRFSAKVNGDWLAHRNDKRRLALKTRGFYDLDEQVAIGLAIGYKHSKKTNSDDDDARYKNKWSVEPFLQFRIDETTDLRYFAGYATEIEDVDASVNAADSATANWYTGAEVENRWHAGRWQFDPEGKVKISQEDTASPIDASSTTEAEASARAQLSYAFSGTDTFKRIEPFGEASTKWRLKDVDSFDTSAASKDEELSGTVAAGLNFATRNVPLTGRFKARYEGIGEPDDKSWTLGGEINLTF